MARHESFELSHFGVGEFNSEMRLYSHNDILQNATRLKRRLLDKETNPRFVQMLSKKNLVELGALIGDELTFMLNEIESKERQQKSSNLLSRRPQLNQGIDQSFRRRLPAHIAQAFAARPGLLIAVLQRSVKPDANQKLTQKNGHCH